MVNELILFEDKVTSCIFKVSFHLDTLHQFINAAPKRVPNQTMLNFFILISQFNFFFGEDYWTFFAYMTFPVLFSSLLY
jgi:hypothetical protein